MNKTLILLLSFSGAAHATDISEHARCAAATAPINPVANEVFTKDGFLFTMNRVHQGVKPKTQNDEPLPTLWVVVDGKVYLHHLNSVPVTNGGLPDHYQDFRMEFEVPGKGRYCLDYRYRMGIDSVRRMESGPCNPMLPPLRGQIQLGRIALQELRLNDPHAGASYMLQDLIEDNLRETGHRLAQRIDDYRREREKRGPRAEELLSAVRKEMQRLSGFDWEICGPVASIALHHSVQKRLDQLAKVYLLGALEAKLTHDEIPPECLPK